MISVFIFCFVFVVNFLSLGDKKKVGWGHLAWTLASSLSLEHSGIPKFFDLGF